MFRDSLPRGSFSETFNTNRGHVVHHLNIWVPVVLVGNISIISVLSEGLVYTFKMTILIGYYFLPLEGEICKVIFTVHL